MTKNLTFLIFTMMFLVVSSIAIAVDWSPQGNVNLKNRYNIINDPIGNCSGSLVVRGKLSNGSWACLASSGDGEGLTGTSGDYVYDNVSTVFFNVTMLNITIDARATTFNDSMKSYADSTFITQANESNLNVNASTWWAGLQGFLTKWFYKSGNALQFNETQLNDTIDAKVIPDTNETTRMNILYSYTITNRTNWDTAFLWGNHAIQGYLTSYENLTGANVVSMVGNYSDWDKEYSDLINKPTSLSQFTDNLGDRGYTVLSNFTDNLGDRGFTLLSNFSDDLGNRGFIVLSNFTDDLGSRGYTSLSNFSNDVGYFSNIVNFTGTLTDTKYCTYNSATGNIVCNSEGGGTDTNETVRVTNIVSSPCTSGNFVTNFSINGTPNCDTPAGGGDVTAVYTTGKYLYGGSDSGDINIFVNSTELNVTIDTKVIPDTNETTRMNNIYTYIITNRTNWDTSFLWGDWGGEGFITSYENLTGANILTMVGNFSAWDKDYNDLINKPSFTDTNETTRMNAIYNYVITNRTNWDSAFLWGDWSGQGFITNYENLTGANVVAMVGNWSADKSSYSTTNEADLLYAIIGYGDDWNKTYADTLYASISVVDTNETTKVKVIYDYSVTNRSKWDTSFLWGDWSGEGFITSYENLTSVDIVGMVGNWSVDKSSYDTSIVVDSKISGNLSNYDLSTVVDSKISGNVTELNSEITNVNATAEGKASPGTCGAGKIIMNTTVNGVQCVIDKDTTYSVLSEFTDDLGARGYTLLSNFTDNLGDRGYTLLSNFTDDLGNRGYTLLSNFSNDPGYFSNIANFTGTLTDTKYCIYDSSTGNIVCNSAGGGFTYSDHFDQFLNKSSKVIHSELNVTAGNIFLGTAEGNQEIYFYEDGDGYGEYLQWDNAADRFQFSDSLHLTASFSCASTAYAANNIYTGGDIYTTSTGDDLWLGNVQQASANFRAYASGKLNVSADVCIDGGNCLSSSSGDTNETVRMTNIVNKTCSAGDFIKDFFINGTPICSTPAGGGDVTKVGTPVDNQLGVWTGDGTIRGYTTLTYANSVLNMGQAKVVQTLTTGKGLEVERNLASGSTNSALTYIHNQNAGDDKSALEVVNAGTGVAVDILQAGAATGLLLDQNGGGTALSIDSEATSAPGIIVNVVDGDAHLRFEVDSGNAGPTEGDMWRESDGLKYFDGASEINLLDSFTYATYFDQKVNTTSAVSFTTVNTGQGANELYDMNQNVLTTSDVTFKNITTTNISISNRVFANLPWFIMYNSSHFECMDTNGTKLICMGCGEPLCT